MGIETILADNENVDMPALRNFLAKLDSQIGSIALLSTVTVFKASRADLDADLAHAAGVVALTYDDPTAAYNDISFKVGASGSGSWTHTTILADVVASLTAGPVADAEASAVDAANYAAVSRNKLINLGEAQAQDVSDLAKTGFLMTSVSSPAGKRTITRAADKITLEATQSLMMGVLFEESDQAGGRLFSADFVMTAGASTRSVGIGFTTPARADTARADATETTAVDVDPVATNDTLLFALRSSSGAHCVFQSGAAAPTTETTKIASTSFTAFPVSWANGDRVRARAWVPNDATSQRRIDFFLKVAAGSTFTWLGNILINAADWPTGQEMFAGAYSAGAYTVDIYRDGMNVRNRIAEQPALRYMDASAALIGLGYRTEPVSDIRQLFNSVDEGSDNLRAIIGANGGNPYRITSSSGFTFPWDRFREVTLEGDSGTMPEIRGSIPIVSAWTLVSGNVWRSPNRWNNTTTTNNGAVICYDTSEIAGFHLPGISTRMFANAGVGASTATLNALTYPAYSPNADGFMYIVLPGGQDPNDLDLELVQTSRPLIFAGPSAANLLWRPRLTMNNLMIRAGTTSPLRLQVWTYLMNNVVLLGSGVEALLEEECSGRSYGLVLGGTNGDNHKAAPYTGAGGSSYYTDANRPSCYHQDASMYAAGITGVASTADNSSLHAYGSRLVFDGGRFWDPTKHNMSHIWSFEANGVDCRRAPQGGIVAAFDATLNGEFAIRNAVFTDCGSASLGAIQIGRGAGVGITTGLIDSPRITTPGGVGRGIQITNSAGVDQIVLNLINPQYDSAMALVDREVGFNLATVTKRTLALETAANLPVAANDTAAASAGVPIGGLYRNGSDVKVRVA